MGVRSGLMSVQLLEFLNSEVQMVTNKQGIEENAQSPFSENLLKLGKGGTKDTGREKKSLKDGAR